MNTIPQTTETRNAIQSPAFLAAVQDVAARARLALPLDNGRIDRAVEIVLSGGVELFPDGHAVVASQSKPLTAYAVNGSCACVDASQAPHGGLCKHKIAVCIVRRVRQILAAEAAEAQETPAPTATIDPRWLVILHGKQFILYSGLLAMAHARGLVSLKARFVSVTSELALAEAEATFTDGQVFAEAADATPGNVGTKVKAHFARMALTRSKARALRDALNISMCSLEELAE